jgi:Domain of unknown function (DUF4384)
MNRQSGKERGKMKTETLKILPEEKRTWLGVFVFSLMILIGAKGLAADYEVDYSSQSLRAGVWIEGLAEGEVLDRGEEITVGFQANEDAYAVVYRINTEGLVTVLWPRSRMDDGFIFGGHEYLLPVTGARRLVASSSTGEGFVEAIISRHPFDLRDLPLDFHHEYQSEEIGFYVTGDPFLAINEVNFAITGMEDSQDFVVTNYLSYYVHETVDHPRYLCNQCHMDDDLALSPYNDECTIEITYDYGWNNQWYTDYGYYPVYHNPVYVYVDPWTWRPWINFWYEPYYRCSPWPGHNWHNPAYVWCDSPYYRDTGVRYKTGRGLFKPADGRPSSRRKTADYARVSGQIAQKGPTSRERDVMVKKQRSAAGAQGGRPTKGSSNLVVARGERPIVRTRPSIDPSTRSGSRGGLQIRETSGRKQVSGSGRTKEGRKEVVGSPVRRLPGGGTSVVSPGRIPPGNSRGSVQGQSPTTVRGNSRSGTSPGSSSNLSRGSGSDRKIKPVEPRKKGTRIWNSRSGSQTGGKNPRSSVRTSNPNKPVRSQDVDRKVGRSQSKSSSKIKPKSTDKSTSRSSSSNKGSSGSVTSSKKSSGKSSSSQGKSSSGGSRKSNSKSGRKSGGSRSKR